MFDDIGTRRLEFSRLAVSHGHDGAGGRHRPLKGPTACVSLLVKLDGAHLAGIQKFLKRRRTIEHGGRRLVHHEADARIGQDALTIRIDRLAERETVGEREDRDRKSTRLNSSHPK